jgi:hypothetical protein
MLRDNPLQDPQSSTDARIAEFTLSLRKLSNKLSETERQLHSRIEKEVKAHSELEAAKVAQAEAHNFVTRCQKELEEGASYLYVSRSWS